MKKSCGGGLNSKFIKDSEEQVGRQVWSIRIPKGLMNYRRSAIRQESRLRGYLEGARGGGILMLMFVLKVVKRRRGFLTQKKVSGRGALTAKLKRCRGLSLGFTGFLRCSLCDLLKLAVIDLISSSSACSRPFNNAVRSLSKPMNCGDTAAIHFAI